MNDTGQLNLDWSAALIDGLAAAGVREAVLSPGARSTPLTLAALRHPQLHCEVVVDERSAAWFALGRVKASGRPVALVCTSGTAVANWLPAVVEANRSALPLLLLSADRPPELHGWGANQTIDQRDLFAGQLRAMHDPGAPFPGFPTDWLHQLAARAVAESRWPLAGPVHLNLPFREPLLPTAPQIVFPERTAIACAAPSTVPAAEDVRALAQRLAGGHGAIVCSEGCAGSDDAVAFADAVGALAAHLGCPILAEPLSGLRFGGHDRSHLCVRHDVWLRDEDRAAALRPDWVLRFGSFPVTRTLQRFLAGAETLLVEPGGRWPDPTHGTRQLLRSDAVAACRALLDAAPARADDGWLAAFRAAEAASEAWLTAAPQPPEATLMASLCRELPAGTNVFCGNSLPIRDLAAYSGSSERPLHFFANRGASGIDGNLATAAGLAGTRAAPQPTVAVVGDLTTQHDLGSLALAAGRPLAIVVINNGGGGIFDLLPPAALPEFETGWLTPQAVDFAHAAATFGLAHARHTDPDAAAAAVCSALTTQHGPLLVEFVVDRAASLARRQAGMKGTA